MILSTRTMLAQQAVAFAVIVVAVSFVAPYVHSQLSVAISQSFSTVTSQLNRTKSVGLGETSARESIQQSFRAE
ncbi:MAG: hypothetical protein K2W95_09875 [Candidatus Obscuribacterales bacterium]|nr:hypothetical protein [Candidatus Obscuribacterales bacterium]